MEHLIKIDDFKRVPPFQETTIHGFMDSIGLWIYGSICMYISVIQQYTLIIGVCMYYID